MVEPNHAPIQDNKSTTCITTDCTTKRTSCSESDSLDQIAPNTDSYIYYAPCANTNPSGVVSTVNQKQNDYLQSISPISSVSLTENNSHHMEPLNKIEKSSLANNISARRNTWELCSKSNQFYSQIYSLFWNQICLNILLLFFNFIFFSRHFEIKM